ncbi:hypothetical protein [Candidatus Chloroploca asiatica]|uniref:Uncharacterized protein n=1 Tax=Candidatus Chloroploca asiatica TaxID=1506545 RepID=A0A2H3KKV4_9CHLR|nr:hypothetical protein [Candidatus Chloroploca asiatica]PDV98661.1 hypothetical protein A9Q02_01575 [Candidatus Chloroploca asiatica]
MASMFLVAYDRATVLTMLRDWTPRQLRDALRAGTFGSSLSAIEARELDRLLTDWMQRALGAMPLRDALMVDAQRSHRVHTLICIDLTVAYEPVPVALASCLPATSVELKALPDELAGLPAMLAIAEEACTQGLALALIKATEGYPYPDHLEQLVPPPPADPYAAPLFEQPTGWRRRIALLLVVAGVALLSIPLLIGRIPEHPAGVPLALLTLGLLVGIRAGLAGFAGGVCIWLVANLPNFHHDAPIFELLWPALPLMFLGLFLLGLDRRVRGMWHVVRQQFGALRS